MQDAAPTASFVSAVCPLTRFTANATLASGKTNPASTMPSRALIFEAIISAEWSGAPWLRIPPAVNRLVAGSNPARGATFWHFTL